MSPRRRDSVGCLSVVTISEHSWLSEHRLGWLFSNTPSVMVLTGETDLQFSSLDLAISMTLCRHSNRRELFSSWCSGFPLGTIIFTVIIMHDQGESLEVTSFCLSFLFIVGPNWFSLAIHWKSHWFSVSKRFW